MLCLIGTILRADVDGHIQMRAYLSGTPECKFGLNDKLVIDKSERGASDAVELDDCRFHQCVRLNDFDADRSISFVPPDGEFELMRYVYRFFAIQRSNLVHRYRATSNVKLPLRIIPTVTEIGTTRVSYDVTVKTNFNNKLSATNIVLRIPTPLNTVNVECSVANGKAKYVPAENVVIWKYVSSPLFGLSSPDNVGRIPRLQGGQECGFSAVAELTSTTTRQVWARPPIDVDFQVLMFTSSGLIVRFLKVFEKSNYNSIKWVRYLTKASGSYQIRVCVFYCFSLRKLKRRISSSDISSLTDSIIYVLYYSSIYHLENVCLAPRTGATQALPFRHRHSRMRRYFDPVPLYHSSQHRFHIQHRQSACY